MNKLIVFFLFLCVHTIDTHAQRAPLPDCEMYVSAPRAYFYDRVMKNGREIYVKRKGYMVYGDRFYVTCRYRDRPWIYVSFRNARGVVSKGYVRTSEMRDIQ